MIIRYGSEEMGAGKEDEAVFPDTRNRMLDLGVYYFRRPTFEIEVFDIAHQSHSPIHYPFGFSDVHVTLGRGLYGIEAVCPHIDEFFQDSLHPAVAVNFNEGSVAM